MNIWLNLRILLLPQTWNVSPFPSHWPPDLGVNNKYLVKKSNQQKYVSHLKIENPVAECPLCLWHKEGRNSIRTVCSYSLFRDGSWSRCSRSHKSLRESQISHLHPLKFQRQEENLSRDSMQRDEHQPWALPAPVGSWRTSPQSWRSSALSTRYLKAAREERRSSSLGNKGQWKKTQ